MARIDLKERLKPLYAPEPGEVSVVEVPEMNFVMVDGSGDPTLAREFRRAVETLRYLSFALKFNLQELKPNLDYSIMPLEALLWSEEEEVSIERRDQWRWTAMVMQPDFVTEEHFRATAEEVMSSKMAKTIDKVRFARFGEGLAVQTLHLGPFDDGGRAVRRLHDYIAHNGYRPAGLHHEIYLSDPLRTPPERMRTILRQAVQR